MATSDFLIRFPIFFALLVSAVIYLFVPARWRWLFLLLLSGGIFATYSLPDFILALTLTLLAYIFGFLLARPHQRWLLWICIWIEIFPLIWAKYAGILPPTEELLSLPHLGLSYYTFQILAYLIEISWGRRKPEKHIGHFMVFNLLFANKIAGPIERPELLAQIREIPTPDGEHLFRAVLLIWLGFIQKFAIADQIGAFVEPVFRNPENFSGLPVTAAVLLSKYQIFCDFSGASLIALGLGAVFGLRLTPNFHRPFAATTLRDFWKRWHISLQNWIRDFVFFPLLTTPLARLGVFPVLAITFMVFGLWHGFFVTFLVYGLVQALLLQTMPEQLWRNWPRPIGLCLNYVLLICLPSVLFRSNTISQALRIWRNMGIRVENWDYFIHLSERWFWTLPVLIAGHELLLWSEEKTTLSRRLAGSWAFRVALTLPLLFLLLTLVRANINYDFIYSHY